MHFGFGSNMFGAITPVLGGGGGPVIPLPIQLGVNMWHNYADASKIIEGATSVNIAGWKDETGTYGLTQVTSTSQPTYNVNKADFDGNDFLTTGTPTIGTTGLFAGAGEAWTVITVATYDDSGYSISKASATLDNRQFGIFHSIEPSSEIGIIIRGDASNRFAYTAGTRIFVAVTWDGTNCLGYLNGDSPVTLSVGTALDDTIAPVLIGSRVGGFHLTGSMYQDLIFDTTKTATEIANLRTYLDGL